MAKKRIRKKVKGKKKSKVAEFPKPFWKDTRTGLTLGGILLVTIVLFSGALQSGFVNWDDDVNLMENIYTEQLTLKNVKNIFSTHVIGNYNPLSILTLAIERHFFGIESARPYHLTNLLLHLICVIFVFRSVRLMRGGLLAAGLVAALFAVHPMRVESVVWVTERKDVLFGAFYLAAFSCYLRYLWGKRKEKKWLYFALALFVPSLLAKIQAVFLPLSMLAADFYFRRPLRWKLIWEKIPFFLLSLITGLVGIYFLRVQGSLGTPDEVAAAAGLGKRLLIGAYSLVVYLLKFLYPWEMSPLYPYPADLNWKFYLAPLPALAFLGLTVWVFLKKYRILTFGLTFFLFNIVMMLQILGAGQGFIADRFTYIAYFGLFFIVGMFVEKWQSERPKWRSLLMGITALYLLLLMFTTWQQVKIWKDSEALWTHVLKYYDKNATAWRNRGHYLRESGRVEEGLKDLKEALRLAPDDATLLNSLGKTYFDRKEYNRALEAYNQAIEKDQNIGEIYVNRGAAHGMLGNIQAALQDMNRGLELDPEHINGYLNRSLVHYNLGNFREANQDLTTYLGYRPNNPDIWYERALTFRRLGDENAALSDLNQAIRMNPSAAVYYRERSRVHQALGNTQQANADAQRAQQLGGQ